MPVRHSITGRYSASNIIVRINTIQKNGIDWVKDLGRQNAEDLLELIEWNERNAGTLPRYAVYMLMVIVQNIRFMRM